MRETPEWQAKIAHTFAVHARDERYVLERYEELLEAATDPGTRFLLELIVSDEHRHHRFFEQLRQSASAAPGDAGDAAPPPPRPDPSQVPALLEQTRRFREIEQRDATELRGLERQMRSAGDDRLWHLLAVVMQLDTEKHLRILQYLEHRLEDLDGAGG